MQIKKKLFYYSIINDLYDILARFDKFIYKKLKSLLYYSKYYIL